MQVQPYLMLDGACEEAIGFYRTALGAEVAMMMRFKDSPDPAMSQPGNEDKIMHARLQIGETVVLMSDGRCLGDRNFKGFALTLTTQDEAEAGRMFAALSEGGQVEMPLAKTFFSPRFGMVADRFGVSWMVFVGH